MRNIYIILHKFQLLCTRYVDLFYFIGRVKYLYSHGEARTAAGWAMWKKTGSGARGEDKKRGPQLRARNKRCETVWKGKNRMNCEDESVGIGWRWPEKNQDGGPIVVNSTKQTIRVKQLKERRQQRRGHLATEWNLKGRTRGAEGHLRGGESWWWSMDVRKMRSRKWWCSVGSCAEDFAKRWRDRRWHWSVEASIVYTFLVCSCW